MGTETIAGVVIEPKRVIADERGAVLHFLRVDSSGFTAFGEIYFSEIVPGAVKGWRRHRRQTQRYVVPAGRIRLVLYDDRQGSESRGTMQKLELGRPDAYSLVTVPPMVWYAFACLGEQRALVANCADIPHEPDETESLPLDAGPVAYAW